MNKKITADEMAKLRWNKPEAHKTHSEIMKSFWTPQMRELAKERAELLWTKAKRKKHAEIIKKSWEKRKKQPVDNSV